MKYLIKTLRHKNWIEHGLPIWWGPDSNGYTDNPDKAGRYDKQEADKICASTHGNDISVAENKITQYRNKFLKIHINKVFSDLNDTTIEQAQQIVAHAISLIRQSNT